jgi:23S rRNA pseudouridine2605 synthase
MTPPEISQAKRLNRFLAECGLGSRRKVEELIRSGRIAIGGTPQTEPGAKVHEGQQVTLDGNPVSLIPKRYFLLNKPRGFVCAVSDKREKTIFDLLPRSFRDLGLFPAGRLDKESEGLLLLTNDGDFAQKAIHPSGGVQKIYEIRLDRSPPAEDLKKWQDGALVEGKWVCPVRVERASDRSGSWIRVTLGEGRKRELRVMAAAHGFRVIRLIRVAIGQLGIEGLRTGEFRELRQDELIRIAGSGEKR